MSLGFTGARRDPVSPGYPLGNGYRIYLPGLMRFNAPDSLSPFGVAGVNPYTYCRDDPVNHSDPSGHFGVGSFLGDVRGVFSDIVGNRPAGDMELLLGDDESINVKRAMETTRKPSARKKSSLLSRLFGGDRIRAAREWYASQSLAPVPATSSDFSWTSRSYRPHYNVSLGENALPEGYSAMHFIGHSVDDGALVPFDNPQTLRPGERIDTDAIDTGINLGTAGREIKVQLHVDLSSTVAPTKRFIMTAVSRHFTENADYTSRIYMDHVDGDKAFAMETELDPFRHARYIFSDTDDSLELEFGITNLSFR